MKSDSVISERGQVTLPKEMRHRYGLKPGTRVTFTASPQGLLIQKGGSEPTSIQEVFGVIKDNIPTDQYLKQIRGKTE